MRKGKQDNYKRSNGEIAWKKSKTKTCKHETCIDDNLEIGEYVRNIPCYLISLRHLILICVTVHAKEHYPIKIGYISK